MPDYSGFVYYYHLDFPEEWDRDLRELKDNGIDYVVFLNGFNLREITADNKAKSNLLRFLDTADKHQIRCVLSPGRSPRGLYLDPQVRSEQIEYIKEVAKELGGHPAVHALYLEDEPLGGAQFPEALWAPFTTQIEEELKGKDLTSDGHQRALKIWKMAQYTHYIKELVQTVKETNPGLKTAICFNIGAAIPRRNFVNMEEVAKLLDIVFIDVYPGWELERYEHQHIIGFMANVARSLVGKEIWFVIGGHVILNRYQPTLREIREWATQAIDQRVDAIGWFAYDFVRWSERYGRRGVPTSVNSPERWGVMRDISKMTAQVEKKQITPSACAALFSYDTILSLYHHFHLLVPYVALSPMSGINLRYLSDNRILADQKSLDEHRYLFATPCPAERKQVGERILKFVESGGTLISSSDDFALDEQMKASTVRKDLLGILDEEPFCKEDSIEIVADLKYLVAGTKLTTYWNRIKIGKVGERTKVLGRWSDGTPAIISTPIGTGQSIYIGTNPYWAALYPEEDQSWIKFFKSIVD